MEQTSFFLFIFLNRKREFLLKENYRMVNFCKNFYISYSGDCLCI